jgi:hypothetical protein
MFHSILPWGNFARDLADMATSNPKFCHENSLCFSLSNLSQANKLTPKQIKNQSQDNADKDGSPQGKIKPEITSLVAEICGQMSQPGNLMSHQEHRPHDH